MKPDRSLMKSTISLILTATLLLPAFALPVFPQERPIVITFGQPNIWSLEQAHYLLARMHRQNLDLQTARLGNLDPNATNASRIDILRTLLSASGSFDQGIGVNNQLLRSDRTFNSQRRQELLNNRSSLQAESTQLAREISTLRSAKANAPTAAERDQIQSNIEAKTDEKAAVDNQLTQTNEELSGLTSASGEFQSPEVSNEFSSQALAGDLDSLIKGVQFVPPSIAATLRLDNHIQLQYEIISKQLTLLRDEVGPGERLVFLELPQSINTTQDRAENKMAQTWWRIAGYTKVNRTWLLQNQLDDLAVQIDDLAKQIKLIDDDVAANADLLGKNDKNRVPLVEQLKALCLKQKELEVERTEKEQELAAINKKKAAAAKAVENTKELIGQAEKELAEAIKSGDPKRIAAARQQLLAREADLDAAYKHKRDVYQEQEPKCFKLEKDLAQLTESLEQLEKVIADTRRAIQKIDDRGTKLQRDRARLAQAFTSLSTKYEKLKMEKVRDRIREQQDIADRLIQGGAANTADIVGETFELLAGKSNFRPAVEKQWEKATPFTKDTEPEKVQSTNENKCPQQPESKKNCQPRSFINLEEVAAEKSNPADALLKMRYVRTVNIIPRQNAINVQTLNKPFLKPESSLLSRSSSASPVSSLTNVNANTPAVSQPGAIHFRFRKR